ncbi:apolipophorins-like [Homarus americanus]|uniref:apolipophorins-like n=1 Tax=Homarus americanus TaxID=6706 RepID=UPI001C4546F4|nr:apolipophorins-like [Homarus americanus]
MPNLLVTCSKINRGCSITVTGKYFNRVAGLLGNFNHEPSDDARSPDGEDAYDPADLARMWAVSSYPCYQANQARQLESISDAEDVSECSQLFLHSTSPLSECLRIVDPRPYFTHCINGQSHPAFTDEDLNSPCIAVSSYRTQCWSRGIQLPELEMCKPKASGSCDISGEKVPSGWRHTYQGKTKGSADVALIFELSICTTNKDMQDLFKSIVNQLKKSQIRDVRYAVVTGTAETTSSTGFISKSEAEVHLNTYASDDSTSTTNATSVVSTAQNLEWRPGVSRTIVHLTCQACAEGEAITQALQANDVTYHLITKLNIIMAGPRARSQAMARKVYGFDEKFVFGAGDYTKFKGSENLRAALQEPESACVAAAQASGGSAFNIDKWNPRRTVQEKKFLGVLGQRVALTSTAPECQECQCVDEELKTVVTCQKCSGSPMFSQFSQRVQGPVIQKNIITEDIKRSFKDELIDKNTAFILLGIK